MHFYGYFQICKIMYSMYNVCQNNTVICYFGIDITDDRYPELLCIAFACMQIADNCFSLPSFVIH